MATVARPKDWSHKIEVEIRDKDNQFVMRITGSTMEGLIGHMLANYSEPRFLEKAPRFHSYTIKVNGEII